MKNNIQIRNYTIPKEGKKKPTHKKRQLFEEFEVTKQKKQPKSLVNNFSNIESQKLFQLTDNKPSRKSNDCSGPIKTPS